MPELQDKEMPDSGIVTPRVESLPPQVPRYRELLAKRYPDRQFDNDDDAANFLYDDYQDVTSKLDDAEINNKRIYEIIEANPSFSDIIIEMDKGVPFEVALAENVDLEALIPQDGEPNYEKYQTAVEQRRKRSTEIEGRRKTIEENQTKSKAAAEEFFAAEGLDDKDQSAFIDWLDAILTSMFTGYIGPKELKQLYQGFRYEEDIARATEQGAIDGRNQTIETKRQTNTATDGIPTPGSGVETKPVAATKKKIFNID